MILRAAAARRVFLCEAQSRHRLARVENPGAGARHRLDIATGGARGGREGLQKIERGTLAGEDGARWTAILRTGMSSRMRSPSRASHSRRIAGSSCWKVASAQSVPQRIAGSRARICARTCCEAGTRAAVTSPAPKSSASAAATCCAMSDCETLWIRKAGRGKWRPCTAASGGRGCSWCARHTARSCGLSPFLHPSLA